MRCLVTGGGGYIGTSLCRALTRAGHDVTVIDSFMFGREPLERSLAGRAAVVIEADIRDARAVRRALRGADAVIHLAALANDPSADFDQRLTREINRDAVLQLLDLAERARVSRFINASSASVYGIAGQEATEETKLAPLSLYAKLKAETEADVIDAASNSFTVTSVRAATVFGYSERQRLDLVVNVMTASAVAYGELTVLGGTQLRPNVHLDDLVAAYLALLEAQTHVVNGQIFNVGAENSSILDIARQVQQNVQRDVAIRVEDTYDERSYELSSEKFRTTLGWSPARSIEDGIHEIEDAVLSGHISDVGSIIYRNVEWLRRFGVRGAAPAASSTLCGAS